MASTLAISDALAKRMIAKGIITDEEFKAQLSAERVNYIATLKRTGSQVSLPYVPCRCERRIRTVLYGLSRLF